MTQHLLRAYYAAGKELIHLGVFPRFKRAKFYHVNSQIMRRKGGSVEAQACGVQLEAWLWVHGTRTEDKPSTQPAQRCHRP